MSLRNRVVPRRHWATLVALAFALCLLGTYATAQVTIQPVDEVYAGYSWLHPGGHYDDGLKTNDVTNGVDISNVYYLPSAHNLGVLLDASAHWGSSYFNGLGHATDYYGLAGLQYKYHSDSFSPFLRVYAGALHQIPPGFFDRGSQWNAALGAGGGIDYLVWHKSEGHPSLYLRVAQVDYIYSNYATISNGTKQWNSLRLSAGLVLGLGNYYTPTPTAACTAQPTEVTEGEPVTVTATGSGFNPKHTETYAWTTNGGKLDTANAQSAHIDTTGVAAGSYTANATVTDVKQKNGGSATCAANYTVKAKPMNPPQVSCSANPSTVQAGTPSTITVTASSPDNANITSYSYTTSGGQISGTGTSATLDTAGLPSGPVTVTATATDARNLSGSGSCTVSVEAPPPPPQCSKINSIAFPDKKRPWRVDNTAKAILDDVASRMKQDPNAKIVIIGYADGEKAPMIGTGKKRHPMDLAAQRAVNAKAYLVQQQGIDPSRIEVRSGTGQSETADIIWVPQGADESNATTCPQLQNTTPVDESVVTPSENAYPKPKKAPAAPAHHHKKAAPAGGAAQQ